METYQITNGVLTATFSEMGGELVSLKKDGTEYLWQGNPDYWAGQAPILFPYDGRLYKGQYKLNGKLYEMPKHGLARKLPFIMIEKRETGISFVLRDTEETVKSYPFRFELQIDYEMKNNALHICYTVRNKDTKKMYFGIGAHPGFNVPLASNLSFDDYYLEFCEEAKPSRIGFTEEGLLNSIDPIFELEEDRKLPLHHALFDHDAIFLKNMAKEVTLKSDADSKSVTVSYSQMPYLGIWHAPKTDAPYVCIEPWMSLPSRDGVAEEFTAKSDLIALEPTDEYVNEWTIALD